MDFLEDPVFPACPSFGFTAEPMYRVTVIQTSGGHERRNRHWSRPLHRYTAATTRVDADIADLLNFYHAVGGRAYGFRFFDWVEHLSCEVNGTPQATDQLLVVDSESDGTYQLVKDYTAGILTQRREIYKPITGTILIADNGDEKEEGVHWTLDYATGLVTLNFDPVGTVTWGGQFHVPVRFDSELPVEIGNRNVQSCTFVLRELRLSAVGLEG